MPFPIRRAMRHRGMIAALAAGGLLGCTPQPRDPARDGTKVHVAASSSVVRGEPPAADPVSSPAAHVIEDGEPLGDGLVRFDGLVRPTKGGFDVRGVVLSHGELSRALGGSGGTAAGEEAVLGAKLRIVADLVAVHGKASAPGEPIAQTRQGSWYRARDLVSAEVVAEPVRIEGRVGRSKGFYTVNEYLVRRDDLAWSLSGREPVGKRVRLWGQPRTVVCAPAAQCLIGGKLPLFDVARAEMLE